MPISFLVDVRSHFSWVGPGSGVAGLLGRYIFPFLSIALVFPSSSVIFPPAVSPHPHLLVAGPLSDAGRLTFSFAFPREDVQPACPLLRMGEQAWAPAICGVTSWPGLKLLFLDPESAQTHWAPFLGPPVLLNEGGACLTPCLPANPFPEPLPLPSTPSPKCQRPLLGGPLTPNLRFSSAAAYFLQGTFPVYHF